VPYYHSKGAMEQAVKDSGLEHVLVRRASASPDGGVLQPLIRQVRWSPVTPVRRQRRATAPADFWVEGRRPRTSRKSI